MPTATAPPVHEAVAADAATSLARETARATEDIARRVEAIRADTTGAVAAIAEITQIITTINGYQLTIASSVAEQTATTTEMNRLVREAAGGSGEIARTITGVAAAAAASSEGLSQLQTSVADLSQMASDLKTRVESFTF